MRCDAFCLRDTKSLLTAGDIVTISALRLERMSRALYVKFFLHLILRRNGIFGDLRGSASAKKC